MNFSRLLILLSLLVFSKAGFAQEFRSESNPPPILQKYDFQIGKATPVLDLEAYSSIVAKAFSDRFNDLKRPLGSKDLSCSSDQLAQFVLALRTQGDFDRCAKLVSDCAEKGQLDILTLTYGASCADRANQIGLAYDLLEQATQESLPLTANRKWATLRFALLMINTEFPDRVRGLLARIPEWRGEFGKKIENTLHALNLSRKGQIQEAELKEMVDSLSQISPLIESDLSVGWMLYLVYGKYAMADAIQFISQRLSSLVEPERVFRTTFVAFYHQPQPDYSKSIKILNAVYPHAHVQMQFPMRRIFITVPNFLKWLVLRS